MQAKKSRKYCGVKFCSKNSVRNPELTFFTLPSNAIRLELWLKNIQRDKPSNKRNIFVCETHFEDHYINLTDTRKRLTSYAIPTLNLPNGEITVNGISKSSQTEADKEKTTLYVSQNEGVTNIFVWNQPSGNRSASGDIDKTHEGFTCNVCQGSIIKYRYACLQCRDFDICSYCEGNGQHSEHFVLRIPGPRPYVEVQRVLHKLRAQLFPLTKEKDEACGSDTGWSLKLDEGLTDQGNPAVVIEEPEIEVKVEPTILPDPIMDQSTIFLDTNLIKIKTEDSIPVNPEPDEAPTKFQICSLSIDPVTTTDELEAENLHDNDQKAESRKSKRKTAEGDKVKRRKVSEHKEGSKVNIMSGRNEGHIIITEIGTGEDQSVPYDTGQDDYIKTDFKKREE